MAEDVPVPGTSGPTTDVDIAEASVGSLNVDDATSQGFLDDLTDALASVDTDQLQVLVSSEEGTDSSRTTSAGNNAAVTHTEGPVEIVADTSGAATLTVEVSRDGGTTWDSYAVDIGDANGVKETVHGFDDVRASVNQNLNALVLSAKGVGG